jgi:trigger factor
MLFCEIKMKYIIKNLPKSQIEMQFSVEAGELVKFYKEAILEFANQIKIEGFRPGHVPENVIEQKVGKMVILEEAAEHAISENYRKAVLESKITPISQPQVEILKLAPENPLEFKVLVSVLPEIKLPDYQKITGAIERKKIVVEEKEIEDSLNWLQKSRAKFSLKNGPAAKGDFVEIEYSSPLLENGKTYNDAFVLGEGKFLPGFEENLENLKDGEQKEFSVNFPADYPHKPLSGKEVNFKAKVKAVQKAELPEMTDEFAKTLGGFENLEVLKKNIKEGLISEKEREESGRLRSEILDKISAEAVCEIPETLVESERNRMLEDLKHSVSHNFQTTFEDYLKKVGKTEKELLDSFSAPAKKHVLGSLVLKEISGKENIKAEEPELNEEMARFLKQYPDIKVARKEFDEERLKEYIEDAIINEKTFKLLENLTK